MHRTTETAIESIGPSKHFGQRTIKQEVAGEGLYIVCPLFFNHPKTISTEKVFHDFHQGILIELTDGRHPLG